MANGRLGPTILIPLLLGLGGCGGAPDASDPVSARSVLETVLEAWKRGDPPTALQSDSQPVNVADYRWQAGYKLNGYTIAETSTPAGFDLRFPVELRLTNPKGKPSREKAGYVVATSPALAVVRDPES